MTDIDSNEMDSNQGGKTFYAKDRWIPTSKGGSKGDEFCLMRVESRGDYLESCILSMLAVSKSDDEFGISGIENQNYIGNSNCGFKTPRAVTDSKLQRQQCI